MISIVMPCYNCEAALDRAVRSLRAQTIADWELLAVDDGSNDGTGAALDAWAQTDERIRVFHQENGGVSRARNAGIAAAKAEFPGIVSLSIDTWGVDYVLLRGNEEIRPVYAYRDSRTEAVIPKVHEILPFAELYAKTGCQFQSFNSIYQLYADKLAGRLEGVTDFLMIPEYLLWKLCGVKAKEYTNATTTGMVSAETGEFDPEIISALGLPPIFPKLQKPGTVLGEYDGIKCVLCATHDTASAVE